MHLTPFLCLLLAAAPDAGVALVTRSHEVRQLPVDGMQFRIRVDVEKYVRGDHDFSIEVATLELPDGGTTPVLDRINEDLRRAYDQDGATPTAESLRTSTSPLHRDLEKRLGADIYEGTMGVTVSAPIARGAFVQLEPCVEFNGAYPSIECSPRRFRVDTGATWEWRALVAPARQKAFLAECTRRLVTEGKRQMAELRKLKHPLVEALEPAGSLFPQRCDDASLREFSFASDGGIFFKMFQGPHVSGYVFGLTLSAPDLRPWADPRGPLAKR